MSYHEFVGFEDVDGKSADTDNWDNDFDDIDDNAIFNDSVENAPSNAGENQLHYGVQDFLKGSFLEALNNFQDAADAGNARAYFFLGLIYDEGLGGFSENGDKAREMWEKGRKNKDELCTVSLMEEEEFNDIYEEDDNKIQQALDNIEKDAFYGYQMAKLCNEYDCSLLDTKKKKDILVRSAKEGNTLAKFELYKFYIEDRKFEEATKILEEAAVQCPKAMLKMGALFEKGDDKHAVDLKQALFWYNKALDANSKRADFYLGRLYYSCEEFKSAFPHMKRAAKSGYPEAKEAMFLLGLMYEKGLGTKVKPDTAKDWIQRAAENGYAAAREYLDGKQPGSPKEPDIAGDDTNIQAADTQVNTNLQTLKPETEDILPVKDTIRNAMTGYVAFIDKMYADGLKQRVAAKKVVEMIVGGKIIEGWQFSPNIESTIIAKANTNFAGQNFPLDVMAFLDDAVIPPLKGKTGVMITSSKWIASPDKRVPLENINQVIVAGKIMDIVCTDGVRLQYESKKTLTDGQIIESLIYALVYNAKKYKN